jgi:glucose uptake protein GlcU
MRRRLMLVMVGLVAVVLVIAGAGSLVLTRNAARNQAQQQLVSEAESLTSSKAATQRLDVLAAIRKTLKLEDADLVTITALGNVVTALPAGLTTADIDVAGLQSGQTSSGRMGNLVYAAAPVTLTEAERVKLAKAAGRPPHARRR